MFLMFFSYNIIQYVSPLCVTFVDTATFYKISQKVAHLCLLIICPAKMGALQITACVFLKMM